MTGEVPNKQPGKRYRDPILLNKVGRRMQELMNERSITHEVFYNDTSINPHRLISGKINMTISTFQRICTYLEISPEDFFKGIK